MLKVMAHDFDLIGEAIFSTRTWEAFGEGHKNFNNIDHGSATDIRFTRNKANTILYVTTLGWPGDGAVVKIKTLGQIPHRPEESAGRVACSESPDTLKFSQDAESLQITLPPKAPYRMQRLPDQTGVFRTDSEAQASGEAALAGAGPRHCRR